MYVRMQIALPGLLSTTISISVAFLLYGCGGIATACEYEEIGVIQPRKTEKSIADIRSI